MRYADADHVDLGSFYSRLPNRGKYFRILGYVGIGLAAYYQADDRALTALLVCLILAWLRAWQVVVGAAWRSSIVAAVVLCAVLLTQHRLAAECPACPMSSQPAPVTP
jgi:hypothetical protein